MTPEERAQNDYDSGIANELRYMHGEEPRPLQMSTFSCSAQDLSCCEDLRQKLCSRLETLFCSYVMINATDLNLELLLCSHVPRRSFGPRESALAASSEDAREQTESSD